MKYNEIEGSNIAKNTSRIAWIDIFKGICITMILVGHTSGIAGAFVYTFHVGAFFFLSGYMGNIENQSLITLVYKKFCSLIIPYIGVNLIFILFRFVLYITNLESYFYTDQINTSNILSYIKMLLQINWTTDLGGATWFLIALFIAFVIAKIYVTITKNTVNIVTVLLAMLGMLVIIYTNSLSVHFTYFLDIGIIAAFFIVLGNYFFKKKIFDFVNLNKWIYIVLSICLYIFIFLKKIATTVDFPSRSFDNIIAYSVSTTIACIIIYSISKKMEKSKMSKLLIYLGKNSLSLLCLHFLILRFIFVIEYTLKIEDESILLNLVPTVNKYKSFLYTILIIIIFILINNILNKYKWYRYIFEGKLKLENCHAWLKEKRKLNLFLYILIFVAFILIIPYQQISNLSRVGSNLEQAYNTQGYYEDKWLARNFETSLKSGSEGKSSINLFAFEETPNNRVVVYINNTEIIQQDLNIGENIILFDVPKNKVLRIKLNFSQTFIPFEIKNSEDMRELSVILNQIELK